jgi:hypothetical protein
MTGRAADIDSYGKYFNFVYFHVLIGSKVLGSRFRVQRFKVQRFKGSKVQIVVFQAFKIVLVVVLVLKIEKA